MNESAKNNNTFKAIVIVLLIAVAGVSGYLAWQAFSTPEPATQSPADSSQQAVEAEVDETGRTEITYTATEGISSLEQLQNEAEDVVIVEHSEFGSYVDSIEGHVGGEDGHYWSFYVDGSMAEVGADSYIQKGGETIEWKYQKL